MRFQPPWRNLHGYQCSRWNNFQAARIENKLSKDAGCYEQPQSKYEKYLNWIQFLMISEALDAMTTSMISQLITDVKNRKQSADDNGGCAEKPENRPEDTGQKFECHMGHPAGHRRGQDVS